MISFSKYLLVGLLVASMTVDCAATGRLFRRKCARRSCAEQVCAGQVCAGRSCDSSAPVSACRTAAAAQPSAAAFSSVASQVNRDSCGPATEPFIAETTCPAFSAATEFESASRLETHGLVLPAPTPIETIGPKSGGPETGEHDPPGSRIVSPIDLPANQPIVAPAPVAAAKAIDTPTASLGSSTESSTESSTGSSLSSPARTPSSTATPAARIVGDRYADDDDLFGPTAPEISSNQTPATDPAATTPTANIPTTNSGDLGLFDEPAPAAEAAASPDTPLPDSIFPESSKPESAQEQPGTKESETDEPDTKDPETTDPKPLPESDIFDLTGLFESRRSEFLDELPTGSTQSSAVESSENQGSELFGADFSNLEERPSVLADAGGLQSDADRTWTDDTATFQCQARLVHVTSKNVILRRASGAELRVPYARLGQADLQFVHQQVVALRVARSRYAAAEKLAVAWAR